MTAKRFRIERFSIESRKVIGFQLKRHGSLFHPITSKTKPIVTTRTILARVFRSSCQLHVIASSFDWFIVLSV